MQLRHWKRLADTETRLRFKNRQIVAVRLPKAEHEEAIRRWKAGEAVDGIDGEYEGGDVTFVSVVGVSPNRKNQATPIPNPSDPSKTHS